ncbi:MAG: hypothetical protein Q7U47_04220, partial [Paludibacter sp.]|nr:hypothetical protein [Paludibacter sp.]
ASTLNSSHSDTLNNPKHETKNTKRLSHPPAQVCNLCLLKIYKNAIINCQTTNYKLPTINYPL